MKRERLSSRLGFILISAGCAIGLGNVWRFPYITGVHGGAAFVLIYLFFLITLGLPIMIMEFAVGRASQKGIAKSFDILEPPSTKWHIYKYIGIAGNYLLMMFYTVISGWMIFYFVKMITGSFVGYTSEQSVAAFGELLSNPLLMTILMIITVVFCFTICALGVQKGIEKTTKVMMVMLFILLLILAVRSLSLEGGKEGLKFYLYPDFNRLVESGIWQTIFDAMGQAFFTLSLGIGALTVWGSYIGKKHSLAGESIQVLFLDTAVAIMSGLIIFPACFAYNVKPDSGPSLIFITLPNIFNSMSSGWIWGALFFLFMIFASFSTVIAVFENILSFSIDLTGCSRKKAVIINAIVIIILSLPCVLGFNVLSGFTPLGPGSNILDIEDFIVSNLVLPIGSLVYLFFCTSKYGWGFKAFQQEANTGSGIKIPKFVKGYITFVLPLIVTIIFIIGIVTKFL